MVQVTSVRHAYPEQAGFYIDRKSGHQDYTFLHFHNSIELLLDGKLIETRPHAVIIFSPGFKQFFKSSSSLIHDWMHFNGDAANLLETSSVPFNQILYPTNHEFITKIISEIEIEFFNRQENYDFLIDLKCKELFLKMNRALNTELPELDVTTAEKFRFLRGEVFSSLQEEWTVKRMADKVYLSESRFYTLYKHIFGISPASDVINAKMNAAKNMLLYSNNSVNEIAVLLGYNSTTHFIRQFKKYNGVTPARYKKET